MMVKDREEASQGEKMKLSQEDQQEIEKHLKAVAEILYRNTPSEALKTFEEIEVTLREQIQEKISPEVAIFFCKS